MEGPPIHQYDVQILARSFQLSGQLDVIGNIKRFLVDPVRDAMVCRQARLASLSPGGPVRGMTLPEVSVRKREVMFVYFSQPEAREQIRLLARTENVILYTPLAILRGMLHLSAEARVDDFLATTTDPFVPVTNANLFLLTELSAPFPKECELLMVGTRYIQVYHAAS